MAFLKFKPPVFVGGIKERVVTEANGSTMLNHGVSIVTSTSSETPFTLASPGLGVIKSIICLDATTTNTAEVTCVAGVSLYGTTNNSTNTRVMTFNADNETIVLQGVSTARYAVLSNTNGVSLGTT